jgi:hypothetical protein
MGRNGVIVPLSVAKSDASSASKRRAHKRASPLWKQTVRQACLDRARNSCSQTTNVAMILREELRKINVIAMDSSATVVADEFSYCMSEDEWIEILQEIELEMEQSKVNDILDRKREEDRRWEQQIEDFQRLQQDSYSNATNDRVLEVLCPICREEKLIQTQREGEITCPNAMGGACGLRLAAQPGLSLESMQDRLRSLYELHAAVNCPGTMAFAITSTMDNRTDLLATCSACGGSASVVTQPF